MFEFFTENKLISQNHSGVKPGDSCISQLLCITHNIYQSLDHGLEARAVFVDISKAFDKVWHGDLLFKLKQNGISGKLLTVIADFLYQRKQRLVLNGQHSSWTNFQARIPQGSVLGPLSFLIYINGLSDGLTSNPKLFADDASHFSVVQNINSTANDLNSDLIKISDWAFEWKMRFKPDPKKQAQEVIFSRKINKIDHPLLYFNENLVKSSSTQKNLEMILDTKLDFSLHLIESIQYNSALAITGAVRGTSYLYKRKNDPSITLSDSCNVLILNSTIDYIISAKRFDDSISTPG